MAPVAADTVYPTDAEKLKGAAANVLKASKTAPSSTAAQNIPEMHTETQCEGAYCDFVLPDQKTAASLPLTNGKDAAGTPADPIIADPAPEAAPEDGLPEMHTETQCEGAYCDFVVPDQKTAASLPLVNGKDAAGTPAAPIVADPTPEAAPEDTQREIHTDTPCEGAYCDFVVPDQKTAASLPLMHGKDAAGTPSDPIVADPTPEAAPEDNMPETHTETQCEGAYCDFVIPDQKTAASLPMVNGKDESAVAPEPAPKAGPAPAPAATPAPEDEKTLQEAQ